METTAEQLRTAYALAVHVAALLDRVCDDPNGTRCQLDDLAALAYDTGAESAPDCLHDFRPLGNHLWNVVDTLDRLREDAHALETGLALDLDDLDLLPGAQDRARGELVAAGLRRDD